MTLLMIIWLSIYHQPIALLFLAPLASISLTYDMPFLNPNWG